MTNTQSNRTEPSLDWDPIENNYVSKDVRQLLGATPDPLPLSQRGALVLQPKNWAHESTRTGTNRFARLAMNSGLSSTNQSVIMCTYCGAGHTSREVHPAHVALFQDVLTTTRNPALALQAHYTSLLQMAYYDALPQFDTFGPADYAFSVAVLMPQRWNGFAAVVTVLLVHFACLLLVTAMFVASARLSLLGNAWQAVAQLSAGDTAEVMARATTASDREVREVLKGDDGDKVACGVGVGGDGVRVVITRRRGIGR